MKLLAACSLLFLTACFGSNDLNWEEGVILPDGRVVVLKREQHFEQGYVGSHSFEFLHPTTKQKVMWKSDGFFRLVAILLPGDLPYILVRPTLGSHQELAGCPYPSMLIYRLDDKGWKQVPYASSPFRHAVNNVTMDPKADSELIKAHSFRLMPGQINVRSHPADSHLYELNLDKYPVQTFQCPAQKRADIK